MGKEKGALKPVNEDGGDDFDLVYVRGQSGWSDLHVVTSNTRLAIRITHIWSDPIFRLIGFCRDLLLDRQSCSVQLYNEPGATFIVASAYPSQKDIVRVEFWSCREWDQKPSEGKLLLEFDIKTQQLVGLILPSA